MSDDDIRGSVPVPAHLIASYRDLDRQVGAYTELRDKVRTMIETQLGDAESGTVDGKVVVRWAHVAAKRLNAKLVRERLGDEADECYAVSMSRRFQVYGDD